jgi:hypothetical protein
MFARPLAPNREKHRKGMSEQVESAYGYYSGFKEAHLLEEQIYRLRHLFPGIGTAHVSAFLNEIEANPLPVWVEGFFAIPNWESNPSVFGQSYSEAVQKVLDVLADTLQGFFKNWRKGEINERCLRQSAYMRLALRRLIERQDNPSILIVPAQLGIRHRGFSSRKAAVKFANGEFALGSFAIGSILLTHPERLAHPKYLWIDCPGEKFDLTLPP